MKRRTVLRGGAAATGGGVLTMAGVHALATTADAQASTTLDVADDSVVLDETGSVSAVWLAADVAWSYDVPSGVQPAEVTLALAAGAGELEVLATDDSAQLFGEASGSATFEVDLVAEGILDASALAPVAGELQTDVTVEVRFEVLNSNGDVLASDTASDTPTLTVERDGYEPGQYGDVGGSGTLTIETN